MNIPSISTKNTKQEILKAYSELVDMLKKGKSTSSSNLPSPKAPDQSTNFRAKVMARVDEIEKDVENKKLEAEELTKRIDELTVTLDLTNNMKISLDGLKSIEDKIIEETKTWERRKKQLESESVDEANWQKTRLEKELEQKRWEFENSMNKRVNILEEEENLFKSKVKEHEEMKLKIKEIPKIIEVERLEIEKDIKNRLSSEYETELKIAKQQFDSDRKLLEQKVSDLESQIKSFANEAGNLRSQLSNAEQHIKDMAVAALKQTKEPEQ